MARFFSFILFLLASFASTVPLHADVLVLSNKDRVSGTVLREENGTIVFLSDMLGEISVPSEYAHVERDADLEATRAKTKPLVADYKFKPLDLRAVTRNPAEAAKAERSGWIRRLEFGFSSQSGRSEKSDLAFTFEAGRRGKRSESRFLARYLYGESSGTQTSDLAETSLRLRRGLSANTFVQSSTRLSRDAIKELDLDGEQGLGLGRNVINTQNVILAFGGGTAVRYRDEMTAPGEWAYLVDGFQDLRYEINSRLSLVQDLSLVVAPANRDDYKVRLNAALTGKITDAFNMSMRYEYEYDRALDLALRDNQRIVTALVYVF